MIDTKMKKEVYEQILTNSDLQAKLMLAFKKSFSTIRKWAKEENDILTSIKALKVIGEFIEV